MDLFFDQEFKTLLPPLNPDERQRLETDIKANGNLDPIIIWKEKQIVIDGHNRYDICQKFNIPLKPATELSFLDKNAVKVWMITHQIGKRNLNDYQRSVMALKLEELLRPIAKENQLSGLKQFSIPNQMNAYEKATTVLSNLTKREPINTRNEVAKIAKVANGTIAKVKVIEAKATPFQKEKLVTGKTSINEVYRTIVNVEKRETNPMPINLPFSKAHADSIISGIKTQTTRTRKDPMLQKGTIVRGQITYFADLEVTNVYQKTLGQFTEEDAEREGGYTLEEFKEVWKGLHKYWNPNESVWVINFNLKKIVGEEENNG